MAWRTVVVSNPARLKIHNDQLLIVRDDPVSLPIEDIAVLLLESPEVLLASSLLSRLAEHGVTLVACDHKHLPSMACIPFAGHSRLAGIQRLQLTMSLPFRKRCWQTIVKHKILNQAECLRLSGRQGVSTIAEMAHKVESGDPLNVESTASKDYFCFAFGDDFVRGEDDWRNSCLDYGYAVLRAAVARAFAAHGFLLSQGIHHHSELNQFNLADDFLEPFRPLVDLLTAELTPGNELTKADREKLVSLLYAEVLIDGKRQPVLHAAEIFAGSFLTACHEKDPGALKLPELVSLNIHSYE